MIINLSKDLIRLKHAIDTFENISKYTSKYFIPDMNLNSYVVYNNKNDVIGICNFDDQGYFSVGLLDKYQGKGLLKNIIRKVFMFNKDMKCIRLLIHIDNLNSIKAFVKLGATFIDGGDFASLGYGAYELKRNNILENKNMEVSNA